MGAARGAAVGAGVLIVLDVLVQPTSGGTTGASRVGGIFDAASRLVASFLDPGKPGIPDLTRGVTAPGATSSTGPPAATLVDVAPTTAPPFNTRPTAPAATLV